MGWRNGDRVVLCYFCRFVEQRSTDGERGRAVVGKGAAQCLMDQPFPLCPLSPSSPVLCCPLGISERESAGPFLNVPKKVQVYGEGS